MNTLECITEKHIEHHVTDTEVFDIGDLPEKTTPSYVDILL